MATSYTSLLGLALPVTGELAGTWGDTVNNAITSLLDSAVAGTTTLSADTDVTLTTTTGASNQARQAILLCSGARTALRTITAPAQSKIYVVINNTTGGYGVKLVGAGPTTGVTVAAGKTAVLVWNGSDFIEVAPATATTATNLAGGAAGSVPYQTGSGATTFLSLGTAAQVLQVNAGATAPEWVSSTGTGNVVRASSPTLTTPTLGVASATSINKVAITAPATGSTLTIADGKTLTASNTLTFTGTDSSSVAFGTGGTVAYTSNNLSVFAATTSAQLAGVISDETGSGSLVFGTSPTLATPTITTSATVPLLIGGTGTTSTLTLRSTSGVGTTNADIIFQTGNNGATEAMRVLNSGRIGVATTSPLAQLDVSQSGGSAANEILTAVFGADGSNLTTRTDATAKTARLGSPHYTNAQSAAAFAVLSSTSTDNSVSIGGGTGSMNAATFVRFLTAANNTTPNGTERMRIDNAGNIGIGTTSPTSKLTVNGTFDVTGNVTLGDATTDTVKVSGYMGIAAAASNDVQLFVSGTTASANTTQYGVLSDVAFPAAATTTIQAFTGRVSSNASAYTVTNAIGIQLLNAVKGAGSTITNQYGVYIGDLTTGDNNYGVRSGVSSGANNWNIYASGTAQNYFAGNVGIGTNSPTAKLDVYVGNGVIRSSIGGTSFGVQAIETPTSANQRLGLMGFGSDTDTFKARVSGWSEAAWTAGVSTPTYLAFHTTPTSSVTATERMRITSGGRVGIGTTAPAAVLHAAVDGSGALITRDGGESALTVRTYNSGAGGAYLFGDHARGTLASPTIVASGDRCLDLWGQGYDGAAFQQAARITMDIDGTPGAGDMPGRIVFYTTADGAATATERMRITNAGNVGIGTNAPAQPLTIGSSTANVILANGATTGASYIKITNTSGDFLAGLNNSAGNFIGGGIAYSSVVGSNTLTPLQLITNGTARVTIDSSGNVGIGNTSPGSIVPAALVVQQNNSRSGIAVINSATTGTDNNTEVRLFGYDGAATTVIGQFVAGDSAHASQANAVMLRANRATGYLRFDTGGSNERMRIDSTGNVLINQTASRGTVAARVQVDGRIAITAAANGIMGGLSQASSTSNSITLEADPDNAAANSFISVNIDGSEYARFTSAGRLGLGTSSPATPFVVSSAGADGFEFTPGTTCIITAYNRSTLAYSASRITANNLVIQTGTAPVPNFQIQADGNALVVGAGGIGYGTGSGGAVTQTTSRTTGVTLNKTNGAITLVSAAGTTTWQTFTVTNSAVASTDTIIVNQKSGTDLYEIHVTAVGSGSFNISFRTTGGTTTEQPVFSFAVIRAVTS